jgi:hypothetical protein
MAATLYYAGDITATQAAVTQLTAIVPTSPGAAPSTVTLSGGATILIGPTIPIAYTTS